MTANRHLPRGNLLVALFVAAPATAPLSPLAAEMLLMLMLMLMLLLLFFVVLQAFACFHCFLPGGCPTNEAV